MAKQNPQADSSGKGNNMYTSTGIINLIKTQSEDLEDGELLDIILDFLESYEPDLRTYVLSVDGDELTDREAIDLIRVRLEQLA